MALARVSAARRAALARAALCALLAFVLAVGGAFGPAGLARSAAYAGEVAALTEDSRGELRSPGSEDAGKKAQVEPEKNSEVAAEANDDGRAQLAPTKGDTPVGAASGRPNEDGAGAAKGNGASFVGDSLDKGASTLISPSPAAQDDKNDGRQDAAPTKGVVPLDEGDGGEGDGGEGQEPPEPPVVERVAVGFAYKVFIGTVDATGKPVFDPLWDSQWANPDYKPQSQNLNAYGNTLQLSYRIVWQAFEPPTGGGSGSGTGTGGAGGSGGSGDGSGGSGSGDGSGSGSGDGSGTEPIITYETPQVGDLVRVGDSDLTVRVSDYAPGSNLLYSDINPATAADIWPQLTYTVSDIVEASTSTAGVVKESYGTNNKSGLLTARSNGSATVTATLPPALAGEVTSPVKGSIPITVGAQLGDAVEKVEIGQMVDGSFKALSNLAISTQGGTLQLVAQSTTKKGVTRLYNSDAGVNWSSSDTTVATVSSAGLVYAKDNGSATINLFLTTVSGIKSASALVVTGQSAGSITEPQLAGRLYLGYRPSGASMPVYTNQAQFVAPEIRTKGGSLSLAFAVYTTGGSGVSLPASALTWYSSDTTVATVSATGVITAHKDGAVRISAFVTDAASLTARDQIDVYVYGQSDKGIPVKLEITDKNGKAYGDAGVQFAADDGQMRLYATVTYSGGTKVSTATETIEGIVWSVSNSQLAYIEPVMGYFVARDDGIVKVVATMPNGIKTEKITGTLWVTSDTGKYGTDNPGGSGSVPSSLTVQVLFEDDKTNTVYKEKTYTWAQIAAAASVQSSYTLIQALDEDTRQVHYYQSNAKGVPFTKFTDDLGIVPSEINTFRIYPMGGGDQYAGGLTMSYAYLFGNYRYSFDQVLKGGDIVGGVRQVYPMLATQYNWYDCSSDPANRQGYAAAEAFTAGDYTGMNPCSRIMFGSTSGTDVNASRSIHSVSKIAIYLKGGLPVHFGDGDGNSDQMGSGGDGGGAGNGSGDGTGSGLGNGSGNGSGDGSGTGTGSGTGVAGTGTGSGAGDMFGEESAQGGEGGGGSKGGENEAAEAGSPNTKGAVTQGVGSRDHGWRLTEMMSNLQSDVQSLPADDIALWLLWPFALIPLAAGTLRVWLRFKRQTRPTILIPTTAQPI
jgi:hypothetical protein